MSQDCSGGQNFESGHIEGPAGNACVGLVREIMGCPIAWKPAPCPDMTGYLEGVRGTPNHRGLLRTWRWLWALRSKPEDVPEARRWLIDHYTRQFTVEGQMYGETTNTSHYQLWALIGAADRYGARHYGEQQLLDLTGKWWRRELDTYQALDCDGYVMSPGSRTTVPHSDLRTAIYSLLMDRPCPPLVRPQRNNPNEPNNPWWREVFNIAAWMLRRSIAEGDDFGGAAGPEHTTEPVLLRDPLHIRRSGEDYTMEFPYLTHGSDATWGIWSIGGKRGQTPYDSGEIRNKRNPFKVPDLPDSTLTVLAGVRNPKEIQPVTNLGVEPLVIAGVRK